MDIPLPIGIAIIALLILISAFFSASETALTAVSRAAIHQLEQEGNARAAIVKRLRSQKERFISAILFGNNLVNILASAITTDIMVRLFPGAGVLYATIILTVAIIIFAEILPKTYAIQHATPSALAVAPAVAFFTKVAAPVIAITQVLVGVVLRMFGTRTPQNTLSATQALRGAIDLSASESRGVGRARNMLHSILELEEITVGEIMIHRGDIESINADLPRDEILRAIMDQPHTRVPLWRGKPENVIGVLHIKAVLKALRGEDGIRTGIDPLAHMAQPWFIPESTRLLYQLQAFRERREHFALVVDEYGDIQGIVTLEDLLEEIVGDISDEHDTDTAGIRVRHDGTVLVAGDVTIRDLNRRFNWRLPDADAATIAGLILHESRQIPDAGQTFAFHGFRFEVARRQRNRLTAILIHPPQKDEEKDEG
jgi:Mg2+/Co2+ transporter CorB